MSLHIGFMYDCHLFSNVTRDTANEECLTVRRLVELFDEDGCGMAFTRWKGTNERAAPFLHGRRLPNGRWGVPLEEIERFVRTALAYRPPLIDPGAA